MMRFIELLVISLCAIGLHIFAAFYIIPAKEVQSSSPEQQNNLLILSANAQIETMVAEWEKPLVIETSIQTETTLPLLNYPPTISLINTPSEQINISNLSIPVLPKPKVQETETTAKISKLKPKVRPKNLVKNHKVKNKKTSKAPPRKASTAAKAQKISGDRKSAHLKSKAKSVTTRISKKILVDLQKVWGVKIRRRIDRFKRYPRGVRKSGRVIVSITIGRSGTLISCKLHRSSGASRLDKAALQAVNNAGSFPKAPNELTAKSYKFSLPIDFKR